MIDKRTGSNIVSPADKLPPDGIATDRPNDTVDRAAAIQPTTIPDPAGGSGPTDGSGTIRLGDARDSVSWRHILVTDDDHIAIPDRGSICEQWNEAFAFIVLRCHGRPDLLGDPVTVYEGMGGHAISAWMIYSHLDPKRHYMSSRSELAKHISKVRILEKREM